MKELGGFVCFNLSKNIPFRFENCSFLSLQNTVDCIYQWTHHRLRKVSQMFPRPRCFEIHRYLLIQNLHLLLLELLWFSICQWRDFRKFGAYFWLTRVGKLWSTDVWRHVKSCVHGRCNRRVCLSGRDLSQRCCCWFLFKRMKENLSDCRWVFFSNYL